MKTMKLISDHHRSDHDQPPTRCGGRFSWLPWSLAALLAATYSHSNAVGAASGNTATGAQSLSHVTTGINNTADGYSALNLDSSGSSNTAVGNQAGSNLTTGTNNIGLGSLAGFNLTTGNNNTWVCTIFP